MSATPTLLAELENTLIAGSLDQRVSIMRRVTDLFLDRAPRLSEQQVGMFDDVLVSIAKWMESKALEELSWRLAPVPNAPTRVVQHLARHDDIKVAGPVLSQSKRLSVSDLVEIVGNKGQAHLLAISDRPRLPEAVTDVLLQRGTSEVYCRLAKNTGAVFSAAGLRFLIDRAKTDETLAEKIGQRIDIPRHLLHDLVAKATHAVRIKLLATAPRQIHADIKDLLADISRDVMQQIDGMRELPSQDHKREPAAEPSPASQRKAALHEPSLGEFAKRGELKKLSAALAEMASTSFDMAEHLMRTIHYGGVLVISRAADLRWETVEVILSHRHPNHPITIIDLEQAKADYTALSKPVAIRLLGYWQAQSALPERTLN